MLQFDRAAALSSLHDALKFTAREWPKGQPQFGAPIGLTIALHTACLLALTGYDTHLPDDIAHPTDEMRFAPLQMLIRRARSGDYLAPPEQLSLSAAELKHLERLRLWRNGVVHGHDTGVPDDAPACLRVGVRVIRHLVLRHPSFPHAGQGVLIALIDDELATLSRRD